MFERAIEIINSEIHHIKHKIDYNNHMAKIEPHLAELHRRDNDDLKFDIGELEIAVTALKERSSAK